MGLLARARGASGILRRSGFYVGSKDVFLEQIQYRIVCNDKSGWNRDRKAFERHCLRIQEHRIEGDNGDRIQRRVQVLDRTDNGHVKKRNIKFWLLMILLMITSPVWLVLGFAVYDILKGY